MSNPARLTFHGGVGSVTGANFLLESNGRRMLVDCGMFQGRRLCDESNYGNFPYDPKTIEALFITHSHIDHIGRIPKLVKEGFAGKIYSTPETKLLAQMMLTDAVHIITEEARACGQEAPYGLSDVEKIFPLWEGVPYYTPIPFADMAIEFKDAGHVLGSAIIECTHPVSGKIVFTGDLGNSPTLLLRDTDTITDANYMVIESVYGDRIHETHEDRSALLEDVIEDTIAKKGTLLIPAFSIERTQLLLYEINNLVEHNRIPSIPVYLDAPLAIKVTDIYRNATHLFNKETKDAIARGDDIFAFDKLSFVMSSRDSHALDAAENPKIIIAGSGMSHGGRVIKHEKAILADERNTLLIVGYQSPGSLGRQLQEGARAISFGTEHIPVRAKVATIHGFSGHRDINGLLDFISTTNTTLKKLFVVMGEPKSSQFFVQRVRDHYGVDALYPSLGETSELL